VIAHGSKDLAPVIKGTAAGDDIDMVVSSDTDMVVSSEIGNFDYGTVNIALLTDAIAICSEDVAPKTVKKKFL